MRTLILNKYPEFTVEKRRGIGRGGQKLSAIASAGGGRYRVLDGDLYFSTSDNSSPMVNNRRYELVLPIRALRTFAELARVGSLVMFGAVILASLQKSRSAWRVFANTAPGVVNTVILLALLLAAYEGYQRLNGRFASPSTPYHVDPIAGIIFDANAEVRWTIHLDFLGGGTNQFARFSR